MIDHTSLFMFSPSLSLLSSSLSTLSLTHSLSLCLPYEKSFPLVPLFRCLCLSYTQYQSFQFSAFIILFFQKSLYIVCVWVVCMCVCDIWSIKTDKNFDLFFKNKTSKWNQSQFEIIHVKQLRFNVLDKPNTTHGSNVQTSINTR